MGQRKECHETNYERWSTPLLLNAAAVQDKNAFALLKHIHNKTCSACDTKKRKKAKKADRKEEINKELFTWTARPERRLINNTSHAGWYAIFISVPFALDYTAEKALKTIIFPPSYTDRYIFNCSFQPTRLVPPPPPTPHTNLPIFEESNSTQFVCFFEKAIPITKRPEY